MTTEKQGRIVRVWYCFRRLFCFRCFVCEKILPIGRILTGKKACASCERLLEEDEMERLCEQQTEEYAKKKEQGLIKEEQP